MTRRNVCQAYRCIQAPFLVFAAPCRTVVPKRQHQSRKFVLGHAVPVERKVGIRDLDGGHRQAVKEKAGDDAEVSSASASAGAKKIRLMLLVNGPQRHVPFLVDGENLDGRYPVDGQPVQAREHAVAAPADMAAPAPLRATPPGNRHAMPLVQAYVCFAQYLPPADAIAVSIPRQRIAFEQAQIKDRSPGIVDHEIFIAVAAAANRWACTSVHYSLQGFRRLLGGLAQFNLGGCFRRSAAPP